MSYQIAILVVSLCLLAGSLVSGGSIGQAADSFDWRDTPGVVSSVKDQGKCDSAWAFAAAGLWEASLKLHYNMSLVDLSAQNIIDCTSASFDCDGGYPWAGVIAIKGIEAEADYPYKGALGPCAFNESKSLLTVDNQIQRGFIREDNIKFGELLIKTYLPVKGPIAAAMDGRSDAFKNYKSGVFYDSSCSQQLKDLKHGVLIVGYGTDPKEGDYWIAKNSWGSEWGEQGYVRIARNRPNNCGLHKMASFLP